jgi:2-oxoglutarate ferredoxin oxidoreductase subunit gamma
VTIMARKKGKQEVILSGFGGQGIVLAGRILGMAAALGDRRESTLVQSYGPESRGGTCCAQVIVNDEVIRFPYVKNADVLICMSQSAYVKYRELLTPEGFLITDRDLVTPDDSRVHFSIPATRMAEELGRKMMANIIMVGFSTAVAGIVSRKAAKEAVLSSVPRGTEEMNSQAFAKGFDYGLRTLREKRKKR